LTILTERNSERIPAALQAELAAVHSSLKGIYFFRKVNQLFAFLKRCVFCCTISFI